MGRDGPGHIWDRDLFPHSSVWSLLGAGVLEEIPPHSHEQPGLCLPGENGKNRARQRPGTRRDQDKQEGLPSCLETTLRATSLVTAPVCGDGMRARAPCAPHSRLLHIPTGGAGWGRLTLVAFRHTVLCRNQKMPRGEKGPEEDPITAEAQTHPQAKPDNPGRGDRTLKVQCRNQGYRESKGESGQSTGDLEVHGDIEGQRLRL